MRWERKAAIARACAGLPFGDRLYRFGQKRFGELQARPASRLSAQVEMARWLIEFGLPVLNKSFLEVGTGHIPVVPIGFYLTGASQTITVDVNHRIDWDLTRESLEWMASHRAELVALYGADIVEKTLFDDRFATLVKLRHDPRRFLEKASIRYLAPTDAADTRLAAASVDCHFSMTVLEHIPADVVKSVLTEAKRILKADGVALHFIDPSDHFQHQDPLITPINFLKYSDEEWQELAGNQFAYCNRLRASDFLQLASELDLSVVRSESHVDERSRNALRAGFTVDRKFRHYSPDDLCTTSLRVMWGVSSRLPEKFNRN